MDAFAPAVGSFLTVNLPGEVMRCVVIDLVDEDRVIIEIDGVPMSRSHQYRAGDRTGARRRIEHWREIWEALDDRDFLANRSPNDLPTVDQATEQHKRKQTRSRKRRAA